MSHKKTFFLTLLAAFGVLAWASIIQNSLTMKSISESHKRGDLDLSAKESSVIRQELDSRIRRYGLAETYAYLRANFSQQGSAINHTIQHYFGEIVYQTYGFDGIKFCGYSYPNGCSHGLIIKTIENEGYESAIKKIIDSCANAGEAKIACVHILGHEFEERYKNEGVERALTECKNLNLGTLFSVCGSGVFMQYYFPDIYEGGSSSQMLAFDESYAFDLCRPLKGLFRKSCILYTVEWWQFGVDKDYNKMFSLCRALPTSLDREDCIKSIGVMAADNFSSDSAKVNGVCKLGITNSERLFCLSGGVKFLVENDRIDIDEASKYICGEEFLQCKNLSDTAYY